MSYSTETKLDAQGKTAAVYVEKVPTIGYVFNKDKQLLMAGFITDSTTVINAASTAKVLLYFAYQMPLQPYGVTEYFINHVNELPGVTAWYSEFTTLFAANPLTLSQGTFLDPLKRKMEELIKRDTIDIHAKKAADINVNDGNVRSGLQVSSESLSQFTITQNYRRRAHAFLYKKSYTDVNGTAHNIANYDANGQEFKIDPASGITSVTGEVGKMIDGSSAESASVAYGPYDMQLEEAEDNATYVLRIVGPGFGGNNAEPKTKPETDQLNQLEVETIAFDFLLPIIMEISGNKEAITKSGIKMGDGPTEEFLEKTEVFIKAFPDVYEAMKGGDYRAALKKGMLSLISNTGQTYFKQLFLAATGLMYASATKAGVKVPDLTFDQAQEFIEKPLAVLSVIDKILGLGDLLRITANITGSRQMEEWELKARGANVTLQPAQKVVIPYEQLKLSAVIKNFTAPDGSHPFFEWKTSGTYGKLIDTKGHTDQTEFNSEDQNIFYVSRSSNASLGDGDNIDYVYVTAYYGATKIGADTVKVNVQKDQYYIKPDGITLSGKEKAGSEIVLYLEKKNGYNGIEGDNSVDYKIVWSTAGQYGKLSGRETYSANSVTAYNDNWVIYDCLDKDTKEGVENIKALIYRKAKSEAESAYQLFDEVTGTIKIKNDPKTRTLIVPVTYTTKILTPSVGNWAVFPTVKFPVDTGATKYSVRLFNFTGTSPRPPEGVVYTWNVDKLPPTTYHIYPETLDVKEGTCYMVFGRTWCGGACDESSTDKWIANYKKGYGPSPQAEVTIFLK